MREDQEAERTLEASDRRLAQQSEALTALTERQASGVHPFDVRLRLLLETTARTLRVDRVSLWQFDASRAAIDCVDLYVLGANRHESGARLERSGFPAYFAALDSERFIAADDAQHDPRTSEFTGPYLKPLRIAAMLDVPLRQDDATVGVLCVEHVGAPRRWSVDERNFVLSAANLVSAALAHEQRRRVVERLAHSEARANMILNTAHDAFVGINSQGEIVEWNAQASAIFGWSREDVLGAHLADTIVPPAFREGHLNGLRRFHETGEAPLVNRRLELMALHREGREFPVELTITQPIPTGSGYFFGAFLRDISDRRRQEEELKRAKEAAEAATRAKTEFLANMSHELRTPLNGVLGYAQLLQRDPSLTESQRDGLDTIARCGSYLLELINDILDLSRIEAGRVNFEPTPTDPRALVVDLERVVGPVAGRKGLSLRLEIDGAVPQRLMLDRRHLRQVLLNLLGNGVKFTAEGEVRLKIARTDDQLRFEVADTGAGIEPEHLHEIFEAFRQTKTGASAGGTGLGLTISQRLVRTMGGSLEVESTVGGGSRFFFALPLVPVGGEVPDRREQEFDVGADARLAPGVRLTALVADDNAVNRHILASLLESAGVHVITAAGGTDAVEHARRFQPDVILMDRRMRDMDGFEATRRIHADTATAHIPVIAVSASTFSDSHDAARQAGCIDFIPKPVRAEVLYTMLQRHLGVAFVSGTGEPPFTSAALSSSSAAVEAPPQARILARRLRAAAAVGDVAEIDVLASDLLRDGQLQTLGQRIAQLKTGFDFEALLRLADWLESQGGVESAVD